MEFFVVRPTGVGGERGVVREVTEEQLDRFLRAFKRYPKGLAQGSIEWPGIAANIENRRQFCTLGLVPTSQSKSDPTINGKRYDNKNQIVMEYRPHGPVALNSGSFLDGNARIKFVTLPGGNTKLWR